MKATVSVLLLCVSLFVVVRSHESQFVEEDEAFEHLRLQFEQSNHRPTLEEGLKSLIRCLGRKNGHGDPDRCIKHFRDHCQPPEYMIECAKTELGRGCSKKFVQCLQALHECIENKKPESGTES